MGDFTIIRGDTCNITCVKLDENGVKTNFITGDSCTFSAKKNLKQTTYDIQATSSTVNDGEIVITVPATDTDITLGEYFYDVEYVDSLGETYTLSRGTVTIDWDVTRHE